MTNTAGVIRTSLILDLSQSVNLLTFTFYPTLKLKLSASADQHASVILRSKTARCSDCFCFSFKRFWSPTVVHLQWSLTSCTMWFDSMQSKRGHEGQISVLDSRCSYSSFPPRLLQVAPRLHATVLQRRLCLGSVQGQEVCRDEGKYGGMRLARMFFFNTSQEPL